MKCTTQRYCGSKMMTIVLSFLSFLSLGANAQNVSYNLNSVPVTGSNNTVFGAQSFLSNTTGNDNAVLGFNVLPVNTTGYFNVGIGSYSLASNTTGTGNLAIGAVALTSNTVGNSNTAIGFMSMLQNTNGYGNVAIGDGALRFNVSGSYNTAIGLFADVATSAGALTNATAIGYNAVVNASNTIQLGNSSVTTVYAGTGTNAKVVAGGLQITGGSPVPGHVLTSDAFGNATWQAPNGGGSSTGWLLTGNAGTAGRITFLGTTDYAPLRIRVNNEWAGFIEEDPAYGNTYFGLRSGSNTNFFSRGIKMTGVGIEALQHNDQGGWNTAIGGHALQFNTNGSNNTAVGVDALKRSRTGSDNSALGVSALLNNSTGGRNTALGYASLYSNTTGNDNTGVGKGSNVQPGSVIDFSTAVGYNAVVNLSSKIRFGASFLVAIEGQVPYSVPSDGRFKLNVSEDVKGLDFINRLRPVVYNFDTRRFEEFLTEGMEEEIRSSYFEGIDFGPSTAVRQSGFIAQEVEQAAKQSGYDFNGLHVPKSNNDNYSLAYSQFVVPLVKSVQELSAQNKELQRAVEAQQTTNELLRKEMKELRELVGKTVGSGTTGSIEIVGESATARLYQNVPNPFNQSTIIRYSIPSDARKASIIISSMGGARLKEFDLTNTKAQRVEISAGQLAAGTYVYSLVVDNVLVDSKTMVLTR